MQHQHIIANPFALLMNPEAVHAALAQSEPLNSLKSRVWRPLDQPLIPRTADEAEAIDGSSAVVGDSFGEDLEGL